MESVDERLSIILVGTDASSILSAVRTQRPVRASGNGGVDWVKGCADLARSKEAAERWKGCKLMEQAFADCSKEAMPQVQVRQGPCPPFQPSTPPPPSGRPLASLLQAVAVPSPSKSAPKRVPVHVCAAIRHSVAS